MSEGLICGSYVLHREGDKMPQRSLVWIAISLFLLSSAGTLAFSEETENNFVTNFGWEVNRQSIMGSLGYDFSLSKNFDLTTELNLFGVASPTVSLKYTLRIDRNWIVFGQLGVGLTISIGFIPTTLFVLGTGYIINNRLSIHIEMRVLLLSDLDADFSTRGLLSNSKLLNVRKFPPFGLSLGFTF